MNIAEMSWMQVEERARKNNRCILFPGAPKLSIGIGLIGDLPGSMYRSGFQRILTVNGHGGTMPITALVSEWLNTHPDARIKMHDWWRAPKTWARGIEIAPAAFARPVDGAFPVDAAYRRRAADRFQTARRRRSQACDSKRRQLSRPVSAP